MTELQLSLYPIAITQETMSKSLLVTYQFECFKAHEVSCQPSSSINYTACEISIPYISVIISG